MQGTGSDRSIFFNAHHSPVGAFASFTLGFPGAKGGMGLELGGPANEDVYIGCEDGKQEGLLLAFPFFGKGSEDEAVRYDVEAAAPQDGATVLKSFAHESITREFACCRDTWQSGDLRLSIISPVKSIPDPEGAGEEALRAALVPAVMAELTLDNTSGKRPRKLFFGYRGSDRYSAMRRIDDTTGGRLRGIGQGRQTAMVTDDSSAWSGLAFTLDKVVCPEIPENLVFGLAGVGAVVAEAAPGEKKTLRVALCFYRDGIATSGWDTTYYYTRLFGNIESVAEYALTHFDDALSQADAFDAELREAQLSDDRHFMLAHAIRSYYGSTELLCRDEQPLWVVNEGEYRMMNTFDLTADHLFFEMKMNPWVVRNVMELFVERYSYQDKVRFPGDATEYPGGISFTHDMGMANVFSRPHYSAYELFRLDGCFSHMTHEQLVNWVCCSATYALVGGDQEWSRKQADVFAGCLESLLNRDNPDPAKRDGIMALDSSRTMGGAEITTYDSLDASLGQARNNLYLAVKTWAAYVCLEKIFADLQDEQRAAVAAEQAQRAAATITAQADTDGMLPAILNEGNHSRIIPAIEGLVFPYLCGLHDAVADSGQYAALIKTLQRHLATVLKPGICLFDSGGWKISSTSRNSWLSKIYLSQFVAEAVLGVKDAALSDKADSDHVAWLLDPENAYFAWSDQMVDGKARGSKYYPRGVTAILWTR